MPDKNRRDFISLLLGLGSTAVTVSVIYPVARFVTPPAVSEAETLNVLVGNVNDLGPGTSKTFRFGTKPGVLLRTETGEFYAYIAICTHLGCIVQYNKEKNGLWCACHGGLFDSYGNVVAGPAPKPLAALKVTVRDDQIYISKAD